MQTASKNKLAAEPQSGDRTWIHSAISAATKHWTGVFDGSDVPRPIYGLGVELHVLLEHPASAIWQMLSNQQ